eukprot:gene1542-1705_t
MAEGPSGDPLVNRLRRLNEKRKTINTGKRRRRQIKEDLAASENQEEYTTNSVSYFKNLGTKTKCSSSSSNINEGQPRENPNRKRAAFNKLILTPEIFEDYAICNVCGDMWSSEPVLYGKDVPVFLDVGIYLAEVYLLPCSNEECHNCMPYDGLRDGIINMNIYFVSHKLLRRFMLSFLHGIMPIYVFHTIYIREKEEDGYGNLAKGLTYNKFKSSWYAFLRLLDIDYALGFECKVCKNHPSVLIMDATSLSFRKEFTPWQVFLENINSDGEIVIPRRSKYHDRILMQKKEYRSLLQRYAGTNRQRKKLLSAEDFELLMEYLRENNMEIHALVDHLQQSTMIEDHQYMVTQHGQRFRPSAFSCPKPWRYFIEALSSSTPVCGLLHPDEELLAAIDELLRSRNGSDTDILRVLENKFPVLQKIIISLPNFRFPEALFPVLQLLREKATVPFTNNEDYHSSPLFTAIGPFLESNA